MRKIRCTVTSRSNYDYGYAMDLNDDGNPEYAFCCREASHGPCGMKIFGKSSGKWGPLLDDMAGYLDGTPCYGFAVLKERHGGYRDICPDSGGGGKIMFRNGKYRETGK